jgi:large subunit ribosomal protein L5
MGVGEATQNPKLLEKAAEELSVDHRARSPGASGSAKKSIANFKLRQGQAIGAW